MKMRQLFLPILITIFLCSFVSAEIMLNQPEKAVYNYGDILDVEITITADEIHLNEPLNLNLKCGNQTKKIIPDFPITLLNIGDEKEITTSIFFTKSDFDNMQGYCNIQVIFAGKEERGQDFRVSNQVDISLTIENVSVKAGEEIPLKGEAYKDNGEQVNGYVELSINNSEISIIRDVVNGSFETHFAFPEDNPSGDYTLTLRVYEKLGDEIINEGLATTELYVKQTPKKLGLAIETQNILPGTDFPFTPVILDQAGEEIIGDVGIIIYDSNENVIFQAILPSGEQETLYMETNSTPGYWRIEANALGMSNKRVLDIKELEKVEFKIINNTLIVKNIGNVIYTKPIEITIGEHKEIKNIELNIGEKLEFDLSAPDGEYTITASDGENELSGSVALTGNSIGISESKGGFSTLTRYPIVWLFLILVFGLFVVMFFEKVRKRKEYSYPAPIPTPTDKDDKDDEDKLKPKPKVEVHGAIKVEPKKMNEKVIERKEKGIGIIPLSIMKAEHTLVSKGRREDVGLITIKIKNLREVSKSSGKAFEKITEAIMENKGAIYRNQEYITALFSSASTKTFENNLLAVKAAQEIEDYLKKHNRLARQKIDYGISLHNGELILGRDKDKVKFTNIGNTLATSKKISSLANEEILLSPKMTNKLGSQVKTEKQDRHGIIVHTIKRIIEREKYGKFIQGFLSRNKGEIKNPVKGNPTP